MVHVEIFTGGENGLQTLGARKHRGVVEYHDTYEITSTNYHSINCHFKSIETWLDGICKSHCKEHAWLGNDKEVGPKTAFAAHPTIEDVAVKK